MTTIAFSPEWRDLALAFCEARDAAMYSGAAVPPPSGTVPESATGASPGAPGSGTPSSSSVSRSGTGVAEGVVGAAVEVPSPPPEDLSLPRLNGAPA